MGVSPPAADSWGAAALGHHFRLAYAWPCGRRVWASGKQTGRPILAHSPEQTNHLAESMRVSGLHTAQCTAGSQGKPRAWAEGGGGRDGPGRDGEEQYVSFCDNREWPSFPALTPQGQVCLAHPCWLLASSQDSRPSSEPENQHEATRASSPSPIGLVHPSACRRTLSPAQPATPREETMLSTSLGSKQN